VLIVAVAGTSTPTIPVLPIVTTAIPRKRTTIWASALCLSHSSKESRKAIIEQIINPVSLFKGTK